MPKVSDVFGGTGFFKPAHLNGQPRTVEIEGWPSNVTVRPEICASTVIVTVRGLTSRNVVCVCPWLSRTVR